MGCSPSEEAEPLAAFWASCFIALWHWLSPPIFAGSKLARPAAGSSSTAPATAPSAGASPPFAETATRRAAITGAGKPVLAQGRLHAHLDGLERLRHRTDLLRLFCSPGEACRIDPRHFSFRLELDRCDVGPA